MFMFLIRFPCHPPMVIAFPAEVQFLEPSLSQPWGRQNGSRGEQLSCLASLIVSSTSPKILETESDTTIRCPIFSCPFRDKTPKLVSGFVSLGSSPCPHVVAEFVFVGHGRHPIVLNPSSPSHFSTLTSTVFTIAANPSPSSASSLPPLTLALNPVPPLLTLAHSAPLRKFVGLGLVFPGCSCRSSPDSANAASDLFWFLSALPFPLLGIRSSALPAR